jgi:polyisoprenoid-binding protein YceI
MKRHFHLALIGILLSGSVASGQTASYSIDPAHSEVDFSIRHMAISTVHGRFSLKGGTVVLDPNDITKSSVEAVIDVPSVDTGTTQRDTHLIECGFFRCGTIPDCHIP